MKKTSLFNRVWRLTLAALLCFSMILPLTPVALANENLDDNITEDNTTVFTGAVFAGSDTATKGAWEGVYGANAAILFGFNYDLEEATYLPNNTGRFALPLTTNLIIKSGNSDLKDFSMDIGGNMWCYEADESDVSVLNMPDGVVRQKFIAYGKSSVESMYTFDFAGDKIHAVTVYGTQSINEFVSNIKITIKDKNDGTVLLEKVFPKTTFENGEYLTFLVRGSFDFFVSELGSEGGGKGVTGVFVDEIAINGTTNLKAVSGSAPRSVKLTWYEDASVDSITKVVIERKLSTESVWEEIASIDAGLKTYLDEDLLAGETYQYRIRTVRGKSFYGPKEYSASMQEVSYSVPSYNKTTLTLDQKQYQVDDATQSLQVKATLEDKDGKPCADKPIVLTLDFGHNVQTVTSQKTDNNGVTTFTFLPEYLGNAVLKAQFKDDDEAKLQHSSAEATVYIGTTNWKSVPVVYTISDGILPNELVSINGYGFNEGTVMVQFAPHNTAVAPAAPPDSAKVMEIVQLDDRDGFFLVTMLPADAEPGLYDIWVTNDHGTSAPVTLNLARPLFISEYEAWNGLDITISGRNFQSEQFGAVNETKVRLVNGDKIYEQYIRKLTPYSIVFSVYAAELGKYTVEISNDNGVTWCALQSGQTLTVVERGADPLQLGVSWAGSFNWANRYDVTEFGAIGTDNADDTAPIQTAINIAHAAGGGVVYIPEGTYYVSNLEIPAHIVLMGADKKETLLIYCGAAGTGNMFMSIGDGQSIGHQGFARFSVEVSDCDVVPNCFFWLGGTSNKASSDQSLREATRFFMKEVDLTYPRKMYSARAMGLAVIAQERFVGQDCDWIGYSANWDIMRVNQYAQYRDNSFYFLTGTVSTISDYSFIENCYIRGGMADSLADENMRVENHGFFGKANMHVEGCVVEEVGSFNSDGETYCVEAASGYATMGNVIMATENTITGLVTNPLLEEPVLNYGRLVVRITDGKGMGQLLDVESIDPETNTITLKDSWSVIPDSTSKFVMHPIIDNVTFYNNVGCNSGAGIYLYGNMYDVVCAYNIGENTEGIYTQCAQALPSRNNVNFKVSIRDNYITGKSPVTNVNMIAVGSPRNINGGYYYEVGNYNIEIRNNYLECERDVVFQTEGANSAVQYAGLVSEPSRAGSKPNADGYFGDHTNILVENNYLKDLDVAMRFFEGNWGVVFKGNLFENVGTELETRNLINGQQMITNCEDVSNAYALAILQEYVNFWEKANPSDYTAESYQELQNTIAAAKAVINNSEHTADDINRVMQQLHMCSNFRSCVVSLAIGGITNENFSEILATGGSYVLTENIVFDDPVVLPEGAVLDLNGYKLTTPSVMGAAGSVIDTSSNVSGRIDCAQGSLVLGEDNGYLPIWDGEAYLLVQPRMTDAYFNFVEDTNGFVITTRPGFGRSNGTNVATYLASADNGVTMNFVLSWKDVYGNEGNKPFVLDKDLVQEVYQSVGAENYAFQGTFRNPGDAQWFRVDVKLESCGVVVDSSNIATDAKIKYDNPNDNNRTYLFAHDFNAADLAWENNALTGKRGDSISSQSASGSYDYPTFDGTSMILNGGGNVNIVKLPVADIDVGTKIVIEANVALEGGSANINWFETTSSSYAYSKITATPVLVSYTNASTAAHRTSISNKFIIRSEIQKEADGEYTITTSIVDTDIQHTVTGTSFPTALIRRNRNAATMTLDYLIIYIEPIDGRF